MELWIRSQDKEDLIKVGTRISIMDYGDEYVRQIFVDDFRIGEYATKERALEVLDEITNILKPKALLKTIDNTIKIENLNYIVNPKYESIEQLSTCVYEMPKK